MASNNRVSNKFTFGGDAGVSTDSLNWVDQRLALLEPHETWAPDFAGAQARLNQRVAVRQSSWSRMAGWSAVLVIAALVVGLALTSAPTPRVLAQRCIDCSIALWQSISPNAPAETKLIAVGDRIPAPDFALTDANGKPIRLSEMKGKIVLVNFWATWCGGCQIEIPWFRDFHSRYRKAGLETIGVSLDSDGWTSVRPYLKEKPIAYTIVIGDEGLAKKFKVTAMPVTVLIDRQGKMAAVHSGIVAKATYQAEIESLLK
jgi:peroxiredoxin